MLGGQTGLAVENRTSNSIGEWTLIQVVPPLVAEPNGVTDYALTLARVLSSYRIKSVFLSGTPLNQVIAMQDD